jgi:hypothetical protein
MMHFMALESCLGAQVLGKGQVRFLLCLAFLNAWKSGSLLIFFDCPYEGGLLAVCEDITGVGFSVSCFTVRVHDGHHVADVTM